LKCAPKKSKIPPNFFVLSAILSVIPVGVRADGHVSGMRGPSVMPSVLNVGNSVDIRADGHVSGMRGLSVMPSVLNVRNSIGIRADGHVSGMRATTRR